MAHEMYEYDNMISVRQRPWHGLGVVLEDYPNIEDAKEKSGLIWTASTAPAYYLKDGEFVEIDGRHVVVRDDHNLVIGNVGDRYKIYQNDDMWRFIESFQKQSDCKIETAGSLKNGATTWVLAKNGTVEHIKGDPIEEYFLFRNSYNGSSPIMCMFTNVRVVCNNTLSMAIRGAGNIYKVRHTESADANLKLVDQALGVRFKYQEKLNEAVKSLVDKTMTEVRVKSFLENVIFPEKSQKIIKEGETVAEVSKKAVTMRNNKIDAILNLVETGAGTNIPKVKGTAYGLFNALTEWADHEKSVKVSTGRDRKEVKFENAFWGSGADFKQEAFNKLLKEVA